MKKYATYPYIGNSGYTHEIKTLPEVIDFDRPWLISDAQVLLPKKTKFIFEAQIQDHT